MKINTPTEFKAELENAKTYADLFVLFENCHNGVLHDAINSLTSAQRFISLTMRDEGILAELKAEARRRG